MAVASLWCGAEEAARNGGYGTRKFICGKPTLSPDKPRLSEKGTNYAR